MVAVVGESLASYDEAGAEELMLMGLMVVQNRPKITLCTDDPLLSCSSYAPK